MPEARAGHGLAYDDARGRIVLCGGLIRDGTFDSADTWEHDGQSWLRSTSQATPATRSRQALVFDRVRGRCVLFGGSSGRETWEYDGLGWQLRPTTMTPPPRTEHAMAFDITRGRVVLFSGRDPGTGAAWGDTWEYDGSNWQQRTTAVGPPGRGLHAMAYDSARQRVVLFGGVGPTGFRLGDTWDYDGSNWTQNTSSLAPPARSDLALAYDELRQRTVLFGGFVQGAAASGDTWEYDGTRWTVRSLPGPAPRMGHAMAFAAHRIVLFGGHSTASQTADLWEFNGTNWTPIGSATNPPARASHGLVLDAGRSRIVVFGGSGSHGLLGDTWEYDGTGWTERLVAGPSARMEHAMVYDRARGWAVLFGGQDFAARADTWEYNGRWQFRVLGNAPAPRRGHAMAYDSGRQRTVLFGGLGVTLLADTWEYDGTSWTARATPGPSPRAWHGMTYDEARGVTVLFGGTDLAGRPTTTWEFDGANWLQRITRRSPPGGLGPALTYDRSRRRVVYAASGAASRTEAWEFDGTDWAQRTTMAQPPVPRDWQAMAWDRDGSLLLFGGSDGTGGTWSHTWRLFGGVTTLGAGCPGTGGWTPVLDTLGTLDPGSTTFAVRVRNGLGGAPALLLFGLSIETAGGLALPWHLGGGCRLFVSPDVVVPVLLTGAGAGSGAFSTPVFIPNDPALRGTTTYCQWLVFDPGSASVLGLSASNAAAAQIW